MRPRAGRAGAPARDQARGTARGRDRAHRARHPSVNAVIAPLYDRARPRSKPGCRRAVSPSCRFLLRTSADAGRRKLAGGSRLFADYVPDHDSTLTARSRPGRPRDRRQDQHRPSSAARSRPSRWRSAEPHPWDLSRTPGGLLGGAAAAVASGMVPVAHATTAAARSARRPLCAASTASSPSRARNPVGPDLGESLDGMSSNHLRDWTVRDSAALLDATHGPKRAIPIRWRSRRGHSTTMRARHRSASASR